MNYSIREGYNHRPNYTYFDDTTNTDGWQKEVYGVAEILFREEKYKSVADVGCGSAFKLLKHFKDDDFIGYDLEPTLSFLMNNFPDYRWEESNFDVEPEQADLVICSDVVEHVLEPDKLLKYLLDFKPKHVILSTPERKLVYGNDHNGPPANLTHIREWTLGEFAEFASDYLEIQEHWISNRSQWTQCLVGRPK